MANATGGAAGLGSPSGNAGTANATAAAKAIGYGMAIANAAALGRGGAATATSASSVPSGRMIIASATAPVSGQASAFTQTSFGGAAFPSNVLRPGQSFSTVNALAVGPSTVAFWFDGRCVRWLRSAAHLSRRLLTSSSTRMVGLF